MKKKIIVTIFLALIVILMFALKCEAADLDKINNYTATVSPRDDGSLDINYYIEWEVLDSTTEGPLEWVKIGIPNQHVDEIKKISKNIKKIKYSSSGGNFVRIDFKDEYEAGEIVTFEFSIHQSNMYSINESTGKVSYKFITGWFEDINVEKAVIKWKAKDIEKHDGKVQGDYIVWTKSLQKNQKITAKVEYSVGRFNLDYSKQNKNNSSAFSLIVIVVLLVVIFVAIFVIELMSPSYYHHGGYGYYGGYYPYYHHHHHHGMFGGGHHGGGFGGGRRRRIFMCVCLCMCWGRSCRVCKKRFLWN